MLVTVIGWYWDGIDNLGQMVHQQVLREAARKHRVELRFTDDPEQVDGPAIIGGGDVVNGDWLQTLAETACRATALAAISVTAHDPHAASVLAAARLVVARDKRSVAILQEAGCRAVYAPDLALAHTGDATRGRALVRDWFTEEGLAEPAEYAVLAPLGYWIVREDMGAHLAELALYAETVRALGMPCVLLAASTRNPDDRAACYLVREWSDVWRTTVVSRRMPELHDVIAGATCVLSSRLHPALLAVASGVPVVAVSANPKVTETFVSMGRGERVIDPAGASADQLAAAVRQAQVVPATWEIEEASRAADAVLAEVLR